MAADERSPNDTTLCMSCGELVWAFRPNRALPTQWYEVPVGPKGLPVNEAIVTGDQCESCFLAEFQIRQRATWDYAAVCVGQSVDGEFKPGCGVEHPVRQKKRMEVTG